MHPHTSLFKSLYPEKQNLIFLPQKEDVSRCLQMLWFLLFPDHFRFHLFLDENFSFEQNAEKVFQNLRQELKQQILCAFAGKKDSVQIEDLIKRFLNELPHLQKKMWLDAKAACERDPAASNIDEIILSYPGFLALMTYRLAHELARLDVPLIPRMMSKIAHSMTGCDIHPEAIIGEELFIDHATGVVIGQTSVIGNRVTLFQGVTLGAIVLHEKHSAIKRHPTLEDDVVIYANATILGGDTIIGKRSVIGGSCWITFSVPPDTKVILANPRSLLSQSQKKIEYIPNWDI